MGSPDSLTLQQSEGKSLHTLFSIGSGHGRPLEIVEHAGGYYLVGGIPPELLGAIHNLFALYGRSHRPTSLHPIHAHDESFSRFLSAPVRMLFPVKLGEFHHPLQ